MPPLLSYKDAFCFLCATPYLLPEVHQSALRRSTVLIEPSPTHRPRLRSLLHFHLLQRPAPADTLLPLDLMKGHPHHAAFLYHHSFTLAFP